MQYSVQYIIAPVISDGTEKTEGLASLSMKKAKVGFTSNCLRGRFSVLLSSGDGALVSMQISSPDATLWSDMDIQHVYALLFVQPGHACESTGETCPSCSVSTSWGFIAVWFLSGEQ